jgi:exosortase
VSTVTTSTSGGGGASVRKGQPAELLLGLFSPRGAWLAGVLTVAFVAVFFRWFFKQGQLSWNAPEDWGHAFIIPGISALMVWLRRAELARIPKAVFWPGLLPLLMGIAGYVYCVVGIKNHMLQGFMMILALFGLVLLMLGPGAMRVLFLPIVYLVFAVTISEMIMIRVTFQLQLIASQGAFFLLGAIGAVAGFIVEVNGNVLTVFDGSRTIPLDVAEACSGMRMVVAFIALAGAVALIQCSAWWQRLAVMLLAAPVAILMNIIRVAILGLASLADPDLAKGDAHILIGTILLVPGLFLFMGVVSLLQKAVPMGPKPKPQPLPRAGVDSQWATRVRAFGAAATILLVSGIAMSATFRVIGVYLQKAAIYPADRRVLTAVPTTTASFVREGVDTREAPEIEAVLGTTNYITRLYLEREPTDPKNRLGVQLHAAYYTGSIDTVPHVPERCFTGAGWMLVREWGDIPVPLDPTRWSPDDSVPERFKGRIMRARLDNQFGSFPGRFVRLPLNPEKIELRVSEYRGPDGSQIMAGYFFIANGRTMSSDRGVRLLSFDLETRYAYYLKVQFNGKFSTAQELASAAARLLDELLPELMLCVPDWVDVEAGEHPDVKADLARAPKED